MMDDSLHRYANNSRLPEAADGILASLQKAQTDLEQISNKLEDEFRQKCRGGKVNPMTLLNRLNKLCRDLPSLQEECTGVLTAKQAVVDLAKQHLRGNTDILRGLQRRAGLSVTENEVQTEAALHAALEEHRAKMRATNKEGRDNHFSRDELEKAFINSMVP